MMKRPKTKFDFDEIACRYDRCNHLFSLGIDHLWRREMIKALNPKIHQRLLDVCTGTGDVAFAFCKRSHIRDVTGVDISEPMLSLAQEKQIRLGSRPWIRNKKLSWHLADAVNIGLEGGAFDFVTCAFGIRNVSDRAAGLSEMHRLLKPGGKLCILEFSLPANPLLRPFYRFYLNCVMPTVGRIFTSKEALRYLARSIHHWHTEVDFAREIAVGGFSLVRKVPLTGGIVTLWLAKK